MDGQRAFSGVEEERWKVKGSRGEEMLPEAVACIEGKGAGLVEISASRELPETDRS